jgi:hypothetical protein
MALPILDGNQSATTLSSILTSGEHIPAHTVVSLGTQAITDISGAVSGSVVSISNFPATQPVSIASVTIGNTVTIAGTVTANISAVYAGEASFTQADNPMMAVGGLLQGFNEIRPITIDLNTGGQIVAGTVTANVGSILGFNEIYLADADNDTRFSSSYPFPISGTVTIGSALPAGTNRIGVVTIGNIQRSGDGVQSSLLTEIGSGYLLTRSVIAEGTAQIGSVTASISNSVTIGSLPTISGTVTVGNSVTIGSLPAISGTVTANTYRPTSTAITTSKFTSTTASTLLRFFQCENPARKMATVFNLGAGQSVYKRRGNRTT